MVGYAYLQVSGMDDTEPVLSKCLVLPPTLPRLASSVHFIAAGVFIQGSDTAFVMCIRRACAALSGELALYWIMHEPTSNRGFLPASPSRVNDNDIMLFFHAGENSALQVHLRPFDVCMHRFYVQELEPSLFPFPSFLQLFFNSTSILYVAV